jgi:two-component system sensor histidine kinase UhpB
VKASASLRRRYSAAIEAYLDGGGEAALERAYQLGRKALDEGLGILDVTAMYHQILARLVRSKRSADQKAAAVEKSASFFVESLSPFEMVHRGYQEAQRSLLRMNEMMELEAKRIAHALHDESGQLLVALRIDLNQLERDLSPPLRKRLRPVLRRLDEIEEQLRRLSHELRPTILDDLGLCPALAFLAEGVAQRTGLEIRVEGSTKGRLPVPVETALYRVVQEALTNVMRHAKARRVTIALAPEGKVLRCLIEDDGVGFDPSRVPASGNGLGLRGIDERLKALGGSLEIRSSPSQGTRLRVEVPVKE